MAYSRTAYKGMTNTRIGSRYNQLIALIAAIVVGMIISSAVNAVPSSKNTVVTKMTVNFNENIK
jgi:hypothetical protein